MSLSGLAREPQFAVVDGSAQHRLRDRAEPLLAAIESLQQARDPAELAQRAALAVLSVTTAAPGAGGYFEGAGGAPPLAVAGAPDQARADACAGVARDLGAAGAP